MKYLIRCIQNGQMGNITVIQTNIHLPHVHVYMYMHMNGYEKISYDNFDLNHYLVIYTGTRLNLIFKRKKIVAFKKCSRLNSCRK